MLADPGSVVLGRLGLVNENYRKDDLRYDGVPWPGTFLLNRAGVVTAKFFEEEHHERYTAAGLLVRQFGEEGDGAWTDYETPHLKLRAGASNGEVGIGSRIVLRLDVEMRPGLHAYAPGAKGYRVLDWTVENSPAWIGREVVYPAGKLRRVAGDRVAVYEGRLRLLRDFTAGELLQYGVVKDGYVKVGGQLKYQACDEKVCYAPVEVGLEWAFRFTPHDQIRVPEELQIERERKLKIK